MSESAPRATIQAGPIDQRPRARLLTSFSLNRHENGMPGLVNVAADLRNYMRWSGNNDLGSDFRQTLESFRQPVEEVVKQLQERQRRMRKHPEVYRSIVGLAYVNGEYDSTPGNLRAAGMGVVTIVAPEKIPRHEGLNPESPNVSLLVCNPHRREGLGRLIMQRQLEIVMDDFSGQAWTVTRPENAASRNLLESSGFRPAGEVEHQGQQVLAYTYGS